MKELFITIDQNAHDWFLLVRGDSLTTFFTFITEFGNWKIIFPVLLSVTLFLYFHNKQHSFIIPVWFVLLSASACTYLLKIIFARPRPLDSIVFESTYSFSSGHATVAVAVYGLLVYLGIKNIRKHWIKTVVVFLGITLILLIGISRLYLGVHYVSDVLAGYIVGGIGLFLGIYLHTRFAKKKFM